MIPFMGFRLELDNSFQAIFEAQENLASHWKKMGREHAVVDGDANGRNRWQRGMQ